MAEPSITKLLPKPGFMLGESVNAPKPNKSWTNQRALRPVR